MVKQFIKKSWVIGLIFLFIVSGLTSIIGAVDNGSSNVKTTWYVDDDAICPGDGTEANPFCNISLGIERAASSGDTLSIASGDYEENIIINKDIDLNWYGGDINGTDTGIPVINGNYKGCVIEIKASNVDLIELHILASGNTGHDAGIYIQEGSKFVTIENCKISDCYFGIWSHRTIADEIFHTYKLNEIYNIIQVGIIANFSDELYIFENEVTDCGYCGILLVDCDNGIIQENICENNKHGIGIEISNNNEINRNTCKNNDKWGFYYIGGRGNTILGNNFMNNGEKWQATFIEYYIFNKNRWATNYWGRTLFLIHIIPGILRLPCCDIPWSRIDLFPSSSEY